MIKVMTVKPKLLDQVRHATRVRHLSYRTEQAYVHWIKRIQSLGNGMADLTGQVIAA